MIKIFILTFLPALCLCELKYCFVADKQPYSHFSHRTPYLVTSANESIKHPTGCTPKYVWSYFRHGTRFPSKDIVLKRKLLEKLKDEIFENFEHGRGELHEKDAEHIRRWKIVKELGDHDIQGQITVQGAIDMEVLAKILRNSFPTLLGDKSTENYEIRTSSMNRTWESVLVFVNAMTDNAFHSLHEISNVEVNDELIALHKHCPKYQNEQKKELLGLETNLFKNSWLMNDTVKTISQRLGFKEKLSYDVVEAMYESCAFESAWITSKRAPFCAAFKKQDLEVFEYKEDLDFYWKRGYGHPHIRRLGCPLVRDMIMILKDAATNSNRTYTATLNFGHIEMLLGIVTKLGIFLDHNPIRSWNHQEEEVKNRQWKLSSIGSFASNIQSVLYSCDTEKGKEYNVVIYYNGKEIVVPKCEKSPCPLEKFIYEFDNVFDEIFCSSKFCHTKY